MYDKCDNKLPQGWVECQLGEVFEIVTGKTPPKKYPEYFNGDIPFVKPGDLDKEIYITQTEGDSLTVEGLKYAPNLPKNTVLVSCIGNLGKKAILGIIGSCNQQINAIIPNSYIENKYTYFYIDKIVPWLEANASATTVKILNKGKFEQAPFILPPLNEQKRIVEKIESEFAKIDEGLEHLKNAKEQIKQYRQSVLKSAFDGKLYKTSEWLNTVFENIIDVNPKTDIPTIDLKNLVSFLPMPSVYAETNKYDEELIQYEKVKKGYTKFQNQDVLFAKITPCMENGKTCIVNNLQFGVGFGSTEFHVLRSLGKILPEFIFYFVVQKSFRKQAQNVMTGAVGQRRVPADYLKNIKINLPTLEEQKRIVEEIKKRFTVADEVEKVVEDNIEKAKQLKQSILKKAFEGRLVPQDPTDEPATKLLEKIKQGRKENDRE